MVEIGERMHTKQATNVSDVDIVPYCKAHRRSKEPKGEGGCRTSVSGQIKRPS